MSRGRAAGAWALGLGLVLAVGRGGASAGPAPERSPEARRAAARREDAADLRRVATWADQNGLERAADAEWALVLELDPDDAAARKRLHWLSRDKAWVRDLASWALVARGPDTRPERRAELARRREAEFARPSARRHRELAVALRAAGAHDLADAELVTALARDPADLWAHVGLGEVPDPEDGWLSEDARRRRIVDRRAAAEVRRLAVAGAEPVLEDGPGPRSAAAGRPLATWRLRGCLLETDLDGAGAAAALSAADLGARWFRARFGVPAEEPLLPGPVRFVLLTTPEAYRGVVDAEPGLSPAVRAFAKTVSALPLPRGRGPETVVLLERPEAVFAVDGALHYGIHVLFRDRLGVDAEEAWLYEGLAAYATLRVLSTQASWCIALEETSAAVANRAPNPERWGAEAAALAAARADEPLRRLVGASLNQLDGPMLVKAWSFLRLLLEDHPDEARAFFEARAATKQSGPALERATGLSLDDLDEAWRRAVTAADGA